MVTRSQSSEGSLPGDGGLKQGMKGTSERIPGRENSMCKGPGGRTARMYQDLLD